MVAHPHGVTLTPYAGDTWVVVNAPGASGAKVSSYPGLNTGEMLLYQFLCHISEIQSVFTLEKVELQSTTQNVIPRAGAVVMADLGYPIKVKSPENAV